MKKNKKDNPLRERTIPFRWFRSKPKLNLLISTASYSKMLAYAQNCNAEISGFARTNIDLKNHKAEILEVKIFKQSCSAGHTELTSEAMTNMYVSLIDEGIDPSVFNCWWHSHYTFDTFFSGTDDRTIETLAKETTILAVCINQKGELVARLDSNGKTLYNTDDVEIIITPDVDYNTPAIEEIKEKVTINKWIYKDTKVTTYKANDYADDWWEKYKKEHNLGFRWGDDGFE